MQPELNPRCFAPGELNLGEMEAGSETRGEFKRERTGAPIRTVDADCNCTAVWWNNESVFALYKADRTAPEYIREQRLPGYDIKKGITIYYTDGAFDQVFITGHVLNPQTHE